jgi:hypothetical protein
MRGGSESDDQQFRLRISEIGNWPSPVIPIPKRPAFLGRDLPTMFLQARAAFAGHDPLVQSVPPLFGEMISTLDCHEAQISRVKESACTAAISL